MTSKNKNSITLGLAIFFILILWIYPYKKLIIELLPGNIIRQADSYLRIRNREKQADFRGSCHP